MKIVDQMDMAVINMAVAREHLADAEQGIYTIKDTSLCTMAKLQRIRFTYLPKQMVIHLVYFTVFWDDSPPAMTEIIHLVSPRDIVISRTVDYKFRCRANVGQYVHAHVNPDITNNMKGKTFTGVWLGSTGNLQGTVKVMNLVTGCIKKMKQSMDCLCPTTLSKQ